MADQFQTFDNKPIMGKTITFQAWRFGLRELILVFMAVLLLVLCIILAGLLGKSSMDLQQAEVSAQVANRACKDSTCLRTTAHLMELLNISANPCDNFFSFACGGYRVKNPLDKYTLYQTIFKQMYEINQDYLMAILQAPAQRFMTWSSENKLKDFFTSCVDDFRREQLKGKPLLAKIFPLLGGWYVKDADWNSATWDLNTALKTVQTDLWLDALYAPWPGIDLFSSTNNIIQIYPGGTGYYMKWSDYTDTPTPKQRKVQNDYKKFMRAVAQLIARDAGLPNDQSLTDRIDVFATDVYDVESRMAKFASNSRFQWDAFSEAQKVTLSDLKQRTGNVIDWTAQMSYLFNEVTITDNTKVVIPYPTYLTNVTAMIQGLDPNARNRKLHNYFTWRVLETYIQQLSLEYVHANRQFYMDKFGYDRFLGTKKHCLRMAKHYFKVALGALYVNAHFDMKNKDKVTEITESVKTSLENMITANTWMDKATKDYAIEKMKGSSYKIGYPDFMTDEAKVDAAYQQLSINQSDYFGSLLACNMHHRRWWNKWLREGKGRSQWVFSTYYPNLRVLWFWDEVVVPAGILQFPMYEHAMPHYYSFGAIGSLLGHYIHHLIDEMGRYWDKGGVYMKTDTGWWSNQTAQNYNVARQCVADVYNNITQGPYISYNGEQKTVAVNGDQYAWEAMSITTGIRLAYNAYQSWQQKYGQDSISPGLQYSPMQLFFIAHAQTMCYNRDPTYDYLYTTYVNANEETRVNVALQELPEFQQAFQCKASDNMVPAKRCTYY